MMDERNHPYFRKERQMKAAWNRFLKSFRAAKSKLDKDAACLAHEAECALIRAQYEATCWKAA